MGKLTKRLNYYIPRLVFEFLANCALVRFLRARLRFERAENTLRRGLRSLGGAEDGRMRARGGGDVKRRSLLVNIDES